MQFAGSWIKEMQICRKLLVISVTTVNHLSGTLEAATEATINTTGATPAGV
jgi:hypothetical protein